MLRLALPTAVASVLAGAALAATPAQSEPVDQLLPDLRVERPPELSLRRGTHATRLRLANTISNVGSGPLEVFTAGPEGTDCDGDAKSDEERFAFQRVFADAAPADGVFQRESDTGFAELEAGCMRYHPSHNHWHLDDFASYALLRESDGAVVGSADKVSFCVLDTELLYPELPGAPSERHYPQHAEEPPPTGVTCTATSTDGISVGWSDTYGASLPGQAINVTGIRRGNYCLRLRVDPSGRLAESSELNNVRRLRLHIRPRRGIVRRLAGACQAPKP